MIRGKIYYPQIFPKEIVVGDPLFRECKCGKYVDGSGKHIEVEVKSLEDFIKEYEECRN